MDREDELTRQLEEIKVKLAEAQNAQREAEGKFNALFEKGPIAVAYHQMVYDENGNPVDYLFLEANKQYQVLTGIDPRGKLVTQAFPGIEKDPFDWIGTFGKVAKTGETLRLQQYFELIDRWYDCVCYQYKPDHFVAAFLEITEQKRIAEALAAEKEQLATTLRSIGDGVITTDINGNVVVMNKVAEDLTGWTQNEAQGKPLASVFQIINETTRLPHENPVNRVLSLSKIVELDNHTVLISRDGTEHLIADSGAPIRNSKSVTIGVVLVFRDITEKQKLLAQMHRSDRLDSLGLLAGGIAHDFNNLLSGLFGFVSLARDNANVNPGVKDLLDKGLGVFNRAKDLTQQLLTFAKGGAPLRKISHIEPLIVECVKFALSGSEISYEFCIEPNLPPCEFDENQMSQVIDNLVINARQAMDLGGSLLVNAKVQTLSQGEKLHLKAGTYVKISITDTGAGIEPAFVQKIFDPFFTTKKTGNGLGLATCYSIMQKHDGAIEVDSVLGKGSTFTIWIPASSNNVTAPVQNLDAPHMGKGLGLIMDDEDFIRDLARNCLSSMGYGVLEAKNGTETLELLEKHMGTDDPISFAILDLTIPGAMGGRETIQEIRKKYKDLPIFASSGYSVDPIMANPKEFGFTDRLQKPFLVDELRKLLNLYLSS